MKLSIDDLVQAKEATHALLEQLGLATYLFEVEPRDGPWQVRVECAVDGGWQSIVLDVDVQELLKSHTDSGMFEQLLAQWCGHFAACQSE